MLLFESGPVLLIELAGALTKAAGATEPLPPPLPTDVVGVEVDTVGLAVGVTLWVVGVLALWRAAEKLTRLVVPLLPAPPPKPKLPRLLLGALKAAGATELPPPPTEPVEPVVLPC